MDHKIDWHYQIQINRPTVLLLHAFPLSNSMWEPQLGLLRKMRMPYIAPDYPGFGKTGSPRLELEIEDYAHTIHSILIQNGIEEVIPVGLSMGGYVALALYRLYPELFKGLVLADTRIYEDNETVRNKRIGMINDLEKESNVKKLNSVFDSHIELFFTEESRISRPELLEKTRKIFDTVSVKGVVEAQRAMANRPDSTDITKRMEFPVLFLTGEADQLTTIEQTQEMLTHFKNAEMKIISNAAHLSNMENPEGFNNNLMEYLQKVI